MGDPAGIGPEVVLRALAQPRLRRAGQYLVFGDARWLERLRRQLRLAAHVVAAPHCHVVDLHNITPQTVHRGHPSRASGQAAWDYLQAAVTALRTRTIDVLVTAPVSKAAIQSAGHWFPGHTEWLARQAGVREVGMLIVGGPLRVLLVTRHVPLRAVPRALTAARLRTALRLCRTGVQDLLGIARPRIAVAGLNPHAGESGRLGTEDRQLIAPVVRAFRRQGLAVTGPHSPDALFHDAVRGRYDAIVAMYHDQGLIPLKMLFRDAGVNLTVGLPFIRTAPDHGTAFEIAPRLQAHPGAMRAAILLAITAWRRTDRRAH